MKKNAMSSQSSKIAKRVNNEVVNAVNSAVNGGKNSHAIAVAVVSGAAGVASVPGGRASAVVSAVMDSDVKLLEFRSKVASHWSAPEWSGAAALRGVLAGAGLSEEQIVAAVAAAGRKSGEDLSAVCPSVAEVCKYISSNYDSEFRQICGCGVPAASAVRCYAYSSLSLSTITADSEISDYVIKSAVPAGASASAVVSAVMSVRVLVDVKRRISAARAAARNDFKFAMMGAARRASRLGLSAAVASRYFSMLLAAVPAADKSEEKRLRKNLASCWSSLRSCENAIVLASPAGAFGAIDDGYGGWCFPASLPMSAPAKCRKLWARRVRLMSSITTLETLLSRC